MIDAPIHSSPGAAKSFVGVSAGLSAPNCPVKSSASAPVVTVDQLSALPSVHVAWALLIAFFVLTVSPSRWRWLILLHPVATIFVVVATANHYWLDGISAGLLMALALPVTDALERRRAARAETRRDVTVDQPREILTVT